MYSDRGGIWEALWQSGYGFDIVTRIMVCWVGVLFGAGKRCRRVVWRAARLVGC